MKRYLLTLALLITPALAQRPALNSPVIRFSDSNGKPLAGGFLYSYQAGTTTPLATYTDSTTGALNTNPVVLDSTGSATVFLGANVYKFVLQNSANVVQWTADNIAQGMFQSSYVQSVFGRTGVVTAQTGDYSCAQITGAICSLPTPPTLYNQTIQVSGSSAVQEPILNFLPGSVGSIYTFTASGGTGYTTPPTVTFTGGGCSTEPTGGVSVSGGAVTNPVITFGGTDCTTPPTPNFSGGGGTGATGSTTLTPAGITCSDNPGNTSTDCTFAFSQAGGSGGSCTLTDVSGSRSLGGTYQNTTSGIMYVSGAALTGGSSTGSIYVMEGPSSASMRVWSQTNTATISSGNAGFSAAILPGYYYQVSSDGTVGGVAEWVEITGCGGGGGGSGTVSGQAAGVVPLATGANAIGAQAHISDNGTKVTISEPTQFNDGTGNAGAAQPSIGTDSGGVAGHASYTTDATNGYAEVHEGTSALSRLCTAANGVCSGGSSWASITGGVSPTGQTYNMGAGSVFGGGDGSVIATSVNSSTAGTVNASSGTINSNLNSVINPTTYGAVSDDATCGGVTVTNGSTTLTGSCSFTSGQAGKVIRITSQISLPITAWSITNSGGHPVATFTATNTLTAGQVIVLNSFGTTLAFNSLPVIVLSGGLSGTQFEANLDSVYTHFAKADSSATEAGAAAEINDLETTVATFGSGTSITLANAWPWPTDSSAQIRHLGTDSHTALASAIAAAKLTGTSVFFPCGTYLSSTSLYTSDSASWSIDGPAKNCVIIAEVGSGTVTNFIGAGNGSGEPHFSINHVRLEGNSHVTNVLSKNGVVDTQSNDDAFSDANPATGALIYDYNSVGGNESMTYSPSGVPEVGPANCFVFTGTPVTGGVGPLNVNGATSDHCPGIGFWIQEGGINLNGVQASTNLANFQVEAGATMQITGGLNEYANCSSFGIVNYGNAYINGLAAPSVDGGSSSIYNSSLVCPLAINSDQQHVLENINIPGPAGIVDNTLGVFIHGPVYDGGESTLSTEFIQSQDCGVMATGNGAVCHTHFSFNMVNACPTYPTTCVFYYLDTPALSSSGAAWRVELAMETQDTAQPVHITVTSSSPTFTVSGKTIHIAMDSNNRLGLYLTSPSVQLQGEAVIYPDMGSAPDVNNWKVAGTLTVGTCTGCLPSAFGPTTFNGGSSVAITATGNNTSSDIITVQNLNAAGFSTVGFLKSDGTYEGSVGYANSTGFFHMLSLGDMQIGTTIGGGTNQIYLKQSTGGIGFNGCTTPTFFAIGTTCAVNVDSSNNLYGVNAFTAATGTFVTALTVAGNNVCQSTGTNCPSFLSNPMTTLGDTIYGGASGAATRLAGASTNGLFLETANVTSSTAVAPIWSNFVNLPVVTASSVGLAPIGVTSLRGTVTFTTATTDAATIAGVTSSSVCTFSPTNSTASATSTVLAYISGVSSNTVTFTHAATVASGATENILCTIN